MTVLRKSNVSILALADGLGTISLVLLRPFH